MIFMQKRHGKIHKIISRKEKGIHKTTNYITKQINKVIKYGNSFFRLFLQENIL
jgi:hypothetical protein